MIDNYSGANLSSPSGVPGKLFLSSVTKLLKDAWQLYRDRFWTLVGISFIQIAVPLIIWSLFFSLLLIPIMLSFMTIFSPGSRSDFYNPGGTSFLAGFGISMLIWAVPLAILATLVTIIISLWGQTALLHAIKGSEEKIGIKESFRRGWSSIISFLWISILVGLAVFGGFILLIIPGIIFSIWFSFVLFILIAENVKGRAALRRSRELVRGYWWAVLWRLIFIGLLSMIAGIIISIIPFGALFLSIIFAPLMTTYLYLTYSNLRAIKG